MCTEKTRRCECALGWMARKHEKISVEERGGKIHNRAAQGKCFVLCHAIAKHTIALFSMTSSLVSSRGASTFFVLSRRSKKKSIVKNCQKVESNE